MQLTKKLQENGVYTLYVKSSSSYFHSYCRLVRPKRDGTRETKKIRVALAPFFVMPKFSKPNQFLNRRLFAN